MNRQNGNSASAKVNGNKSFLPVKLGRTGRMGGYTAIMALVMIAAVIFVNLIVSAIPAKYTKLDTSVNNIYTMSASSQNFISKVSEDVTLWFVCSGGTEDEMMRTFLDRYSALSGHIKVKVADPVKDATLLERFPDLGSADNYSVLAESAKRTKLVNYSELYYYHSDSAGDLSVSEYNQYTSYYGSSFESYYGPFELFFSGDSKITGAIEYVTAEKVPTLYNLDGHGEQELSTTLVSSILDPLGVVHSSFNIALGDPIPDDCDLIIINSPSIDITADEASMLTAFFENGGGILLLTSPTMPDCPNLTKLASAAGMSAISGTISEGDSSRYYPRNPQYIFPIINTDHDASSTASEYDGKILTSRSHGISLDGGEGITQTWLLKTTEKATTSENSESASYILAAASEKGSGKFVWVASAEMMNDTFLSLRLDYQNSYNIIFPYSLLSWMSSFFESSLGSIESISMSTPTLTVSDGQANFWGGVLIFIVPLACVAAAVAIVVVRRRR